MTAEFVRGICFDYCLRFIWAWNGVFAFHYVFHLGLQFTALFLYCSTPSFISGVRRPTPILQMMKRVETYVFSPSKFAFCILPLLYTKAFREQCVCNMRPSRRTSPALNSDNQTTTASAFASSRTSQVPSHRHPKIWSRSRRRLAPSDLGAAISDWDGRS